MSRKKMRFLSVLLSTTMALSMLPVSAFASQTGATDQCQTDSLELPVQSQMISDFADEWDDEELYEGYLAAMFYDAPDEISMFWDPTSNLDESLKEAYDEIKSKLERIAAGEVVSTKISVSKGFSETTESDFAQRVDILYHALLAGMPYDLYWHNKTQGIIMGYSIKNVGGESYVDSLTLGFAVNEKNASGEPENGKYYTTNLNQEGQLQRAKVASQNAQRIVNDNNSKSDYEKLVAYKEAVCELTSYNDAAAEWTSPVTDIDPWQLIYVFDGNPDTNVVCEGYSKAFQYLCDLSTFSEGVYSILVDGVMSANGSSGPHMWNVVHIDDKNYLVDVTNCDTGSIGVPDKLFLVGATDLGSGLLTVNGLSVSYSYSNKSKAIYTDAELALSTNNYHVHSFGTATNKDLTYTWSPAGTTVSDENTDIYLTATGHCTACDKDVELMQTKVAIGSEYRKPATCIEDGYIGVSGLTVSVDPLGKGEGSKHKVSIPVYRIPAKGSHDFGEDGKEEKCAECSIKNINWTGLSISATQAIYTGGELTADISGIDSANYVVKNSSDKATAVGTHKVTIEGKNEYCGTREIDWKIVYLDTSAVASVASYNSGENGWYKGSSVTLNAPGGFFVSLDGPDSETGTWSDSVSVNSSHLSDGSCGYYLKNSAGQITDKKTITIRLDDSAPSISSVTFSESENLIAKFTSWFFGKQTIEVTVSATDLDSGVKSLQYQIGSGSSQSVDFVDGTATFTISGEQKSEVKLLAKDLVGNESEVSTYNVCLDHAKPMITDQSNYSGWVTVENAKLSVKADDVGSGVAKVVSWVDEGSRTTIFDGSSTQVFTSGVLSVDLQRGVHTYHFEATDHSGNVHTKDIEIKYDASLPVLSKVEVTEVKDVSAKLSITASDNLTTALKYYVLCQTTAVPADKSAVAVDGNLVTPENGVVALNGLTQNTSYYYAVVVKDEAGLVSEIQSGSFHTKKTQPTITKEPAISGTYGETLASMLQNGTASVAGSWSVANGSTYLDAGTTTPVEVTFTPSDSSQYSPVSVLVTPSVAKRVAVLDWSSTRAFEYDGEAHGVTATVSNLLPGDRVTVATYQANTNINAGTYTAEALTLAGEESQNYCLTGESNITCSYEIKTNDITGKSVEITLGAALTYNGNDQIQTVTGVKLNGKDVTYTVSGNGAKDAGTYTLTITGKDNYSGVVTKEFEVEKAEVSITLGKLSQKKGSTSAVSATLNPTSSDAKVTIEYYVLSKSATPASECKIVHDASCAFLSSNYLADCDCEKNHKAHSEECGYAEAAEAEYQWTETVPTEIGKYDVRAYLLSANAGKNLMGYENFAAAQTADKVVTGTLEISAPVTNPPSGGGGGSSSGGSSSGGSSGGSPSGGSPSGGNPSSGTENTTKPEETKPEDAKPGVQETETVKNEDGSTTTTTVENNEDGSSVKTEITTKTDGTEKTVVTETAQDGQVKTTTTLTDQNGNVTSVTEKNILKEVVKDTSATVEVMKNGDGDVTSAKATVTTVTNSKKATINGAVVEQVEKTAGTDVQISMNVADKNGKLLYTLKVDSKELEAGNKLYIYRLNTKTQKYTMVNAKTYVVAKDGSVSVNLSKKATYELVSTAKSKAIEKQIKDTIKPKKSSDKVTVGKKVKASLAKSVDMANVEKVTYSVTNPKVAKVTKNGNVQGKKAGTTTVKIKVTLKNGSTKTVKIKLIVKKAG